MNPGQNEEVMQEQVMGVVMADITPEQVLR